MADINAVEETGKIEKVQQVSKSLTSLQERMMELRERQSLPANKEYFDSLMRQEKADVEKQATEGSLSPTEEMAKVNQRPQDLATQNVEQNDRLASPMEEAARIHGNKIVPFEGALATDMQAQIASASTKIESLKQTLNRPDLKIRSSSQPLLRNKLKGIDEDLDIAHKNAGLDFAPAPEAIEGQVNPIERFLGMLTHSQSRLEKLGSYFEHLDQNPEKMNPAHVLAVQIKVHHITTELEFFTSLLNKSLEGTKTVMNVQV